MRRVLRFCGKLLLLCVCAQIVGVDAAFAQTSGLPSGWSNSDVGSPALSGRVETSSGSITVEGGGADVWGTSDQFHFAYRQISGDVDISVRVASVAYADQWTKAGVMVRESLEGGARHAFMLSSAGSGLAFQWRTAANDSTAHADGGGGPAPVWVRLVRKGSLISGYTSGDGSVWTLVSTALIEMPAAAYVGLAVTSHNPDQLAPATFTNLSLYAPTLADWTGLDIGEPSLAGSFTGSGDGFRVTGAGADIWGDWDQFHYVFRSVTGDVDIVARVASLEHTDQWAKAGVMIREGLTGSAAHASMLATGSSGWSFQHRPWNWAESHHTSGGSGSAPGWVRLVRVGDLFTAYQSPDGQNWRLAGNATIPMGASVYVGLAVTSHVTTRLTTAVFDNVKLVSPSTSTDSGSPSPPPGADEPSPGGTPAPSPPTTLPAEWQTGDLGDPDVTGEASYDSGTFTVTGAGLDIWNDSDQFRFVYRTMSGDAEVVARVTSLLQVDDWSKAGVMIREGLTGPAKHASVFATGTGGWAFQRRPSTGGASQHTSGDSGSPPGWVRLVRQGELFSAFASQDGTNWKLIGTHPIPMPATVYVGLAVTSHNVSTATTATFTNVSVTAPVSGGLTGTLTVSNPDGSTNFTAPATLVLTATYTGGSGAPAKVDFYRGDTLIGSDSSSPFSVTWNSVAAGDYTITAVARDPSGTALAHTSTRVVVGSAAATPIFAVFVASTDHDSGVDSYTLEFRRAGDALTAAPVATKNIGKPTVVAGEISVDISGTVGALAAGSYYAAVFASGPGGFSSRAVSDVFSK